MNTKMFLVLFLFCSLLFLVAAIPGPDVPQPPPGCTVFDYIEWPAKDSTHWGGYNVSSPWQVCGVGIEVDGEWHTLVWNVNNNCATNSNGDITCGVIEGNVELRLMETGTGVQGFDTLAPAGMSAGVWWVPNPQPVSQERYDTYLPFAFNSWGVCYKGCVGPPPIP